MLLVQQVSTTLLHHAKCGLEPLSCFQTHSFALPTCLVLAPFPPALIFHQTLRLPFLSVTAFLDNRHAEPIHGRRERCCWMDTHIPFYGSRFPSMIPICLPDPEGSREAWQSTTVLLLCHQTFQEVNATLDFKCVCGWVGTVGCACRGH